MPIGLIRRGAKACFTMSRLSAEDSQSKSWPPVRLRHGSGGDVLSDREPSRESATCRLKIQMREVCRPVRWEGWRNSMRRPCLAGREREVGCLRSL